MHLCKTAVNFLGHVVSGEGVAPQHKKVEAIADWPTPTNLAEVRSFLGLASFYRKFIYMFAAVAQPLHQLTKKDAPWQWRPDHEERAFQMLKKALTMAPLLVLPDVEAAMTGKAPYLVQCDASLLAWGGVIMQDQGRGYQPIAFASKTFNSAQANYSATERELLALVSCTCEEFRHYLFGTRLHIVVNPSWIGLVPLPLLVETGFDIERVKVVWASYEKCSGFAILYGEIN